MECIASRFESKHLMNIFSLVVLEARLDYDFPLKSFNSKQICQMCHFQLLVSLYRAYLLKALVSDAMAITVYSQSVCVFVGLSGELLKHYAF